ncbi:MAG: diguanylate cyclase [Pseudomonadota bacterium]
MPVVEKTERRTRLMLEFLRKEADYKRLPQELWTELELEYGENVHSEILFLLTQMRFEPEEARTHWYNVLAHRNELEQSLGRDVGLLVALADYFINVRPKVKNPIIVEISIMLKKEESALKDELTGLYNRRFFNRMFQQELERARRFNEPVSLLILDVDNFKNFNDQYGHLAGDQVLVQLAEIMRSTGRSIDHVTRYGGEEFAIILPKADQGQALGAAERHRLAVEKSVFQIGGREQRITISAGAATYPDDAQDGLRLIEVADKALYEAKKAGRNRAFAACQEKRLHVRSPLALNINLRFAGYSDFRQARTKNISLGGLGGEIPGPIIENPGLEIHLLFEEGFPELTLQGQLVRFIPTEQEDVYDIGVRFEFTSEQDRDTLKELVSKHVWDFH